MSGTAHERTNRIKELFASALPLEAAARVAALDRVCAGDAELRKAVDDLLESYDSAQPFFAQFPEGFARDVLGLAMTPPTFSDGELVAGRFRVVRFIAAGGMGEVYEAEDLLLECEHVALKTLAADVSGDEHAIARLRREMALARRVTHRNVCRAFDVDQHVSSSGVVIAFFTMELLEGETLAERLSRSGRMSTEEALPLVRQMVAALSSAHSAGIVHGDFKPGNVVLVPSPEGGERLVVTDFGLARRASSDAAPPTTTINRVAWGTPVYMAPEQFVSHRPTRATDVYSLAAVVLEMVTGKRPFETNPATADLDLSWRLAIARGLDHNPEARFDSVDDFLHAVHPESRVGWRVGGGLAALVVALLLLLSPVRSMLRATIASDPAAVSEPQHSVAVLAFADTDRTLEGEAFARGLAATVTDQLRTVAEYKPRLLFVPTDAMLATGVNSPERAHRTVGADLIVTSRVDGPVGQRHVTIELHQMRGEAPTRSRIRRVDIGVGDQMLPVVRSEVARMLPVPVAAEAFASLDASSSRGAAEDWYVRGRGYLEQGRTPRLDVPRLELAVDAFERTIELDGLFAPAHAALGEALVLKYEATRDSNKDTHLLDAAERSAAEASRRQPNVAHFHVVRALTYLATGRHALAIPALEEALRIDPDAVGARENLAKSYTATGQLPRAEQTLEQGIIARPQYWSAHEDLGVFRLNQGQYKEAEVQFLAGREYAPDNPRVIRNLGAVYTMTEQFDAAEQELKRGLALAPDVLLYNNLGWAYFYQGNFVDGVDSLKKAVELTTDDSVVLAGLARGYRWMGRPAEARAAYEIAIAAARRQISADPRNAEVRANLAYLYAETGNYGEAGRLIDRALDDAPENVRVRFMSALVLELTGQRRAALDALQWAIGRGHPKYQIAYHPDLRALRTDDRYVQLVGRVDWKR
jgi:eukaryotic-like serine/threonine-protein kinase